MNSRLSMRVLFAVLTAAVVPAALHAELSCAPVNIVLDGGFEQASGEPPVSPDWLGSSTQLGSPVCSLSSCAPTSESGPRTGVSWTLFEGTNDPAGESATLAQSIVLPPATVIDLNFHLRIGAVSAPFTDVLEVRIDGVTLGSYLEPGVAESDYSLRSFNLDAYADGTAHTLEFVFLGPGNGGFAAFNVDDVALVARQVATLQDGSFEGAVGDPLDSPNWVEASLQYFSPLCTLDLCGDGSGTVGPLTGLVWSWFGGVGGSTPESSSLSQVVRLPKAAYMDLTFQMGVGAVEAPFSDELGVKMDGGTIASYLEPVVADTSYLPRSLIVDAFADGLPHTLQFEYVKAVDGNGANFSLDDVALTQVSCQALLLDGFETHDASNWSLAVL